MKKTKPHRERDKGLHPQHGTTETTKSSHDAGGRTPPQGGDDGAPRYTYRPNWLLIGTLLLVSVVLAVGSFLLRRYQLARNSAIYRERAYTLYERGELAKALTWMRRYLLFNPADVDALADFGTWVEKSANDGDSYFLAFLTYESVLRKSPERHDLRRKLVDVAMVLGRYSDALYHLETLLKSNPQDTELIGKSAVCEAGLGHFAKAIGLYRQAIDREPQKLDWYWGLIQLARSGRAELRPVDLLPQTDENSPKDQASETNQEASAPSADTAKTFDEILQDWLTRMVDQGQPKWRALLLRSQFYLEVGNMDAAESDLASARQFNPEGVDIDLQLAQIKLQRAEQSRESGRPADAEQLTQEALAIVETVISDNANDVRLHAALAQILLALKRLDDAEKTVRDALQRCTVQIRDAQIQGDKVRVGQLAELRANVYFLLATILIERIDSGGDVAQTTQQVEELLSQAADYGLTEVRQKFLRGQLLFTQRAWRQAYDVLESIRPQVESIRQLRQRTDLLLGQCAEMLQNPDERVRIFRRALASDPAWLLGRLQLADALAKAGLFREAMDHYRALINVRGVPAALAELLVGEQLRLPEAERRWQPVWNFLHEAAAREPDSAMIVIRQAQVATIEEKFDDADRLLQTARERFPEEVVVWEASVRMVLARTDWDLKDRRQAAEELLVQAEQRFGDRVELRLAQAAGVNHLPPQEQETALQQLGQQVDRFSIAERVRLWDGLAQVSLQLGKASLAQNYWEQAAAAEPLNLGPRLALANLALERRDAKALADLTAAVRAIEGNNGPHGNYLEASKLLLSLEETVNVRQEPLSSSNRDLERAVELLRQVSQQRPLWPVPQAMLGELAYHVGDKESAVEYFRRARTLGDTSPRVLTRLVGTLSEMGRIAEADAELRSATVGQSTFASPELARMAWQLAWQKRDFSTAEAMADRLATSTNDVRDYLWLSILRQAQGKPAAEVEEPLRKAVEVAPRNPTAWRNLVLHLARTNRTDEARQTITTALAQLPDEPAYVKTVFQAECLEILGSLDEAQQLYETAVQSSPEEFRLRVVMADFLTRRGNWAAARPHLRYLMDGKTNTPKLVVEWARARMAESVAVTGTYVDFSSALAMLQFSAAEDRLTKLYRLRAQASLLARRSTWRDRRQLIDILEQLATMDRLSQNESFILASCYFYTGERQKAVDLFRRLVQDDDQRVEWVSALVRALLDQDSPSPTDVTLASQWVDHLVKLDATSPLTMEARLRLLAATGETTAVEPIVGEFFAKLKDQPLPVETYREVARLCADLKFDQMAESLYMKAIHAGHQQAILPDFIRFLSYRGRVDDAVYWLEVARQQNIGGGAWARLATALLISNEVSSSTARQLAQGILDAISAEPELPLSLHALAELHIAERRLTEAEKVYRQILSGDPKNVTALNNLAWLLAHQRRNVVEAVQLAQQAIDVAGPHGTLLDTRGLAYMAAGRYEEAIADLEEATRNTPPPSTWLHLAEAYLAGGRNAEAWTAYQQGKKAGLAIAKLSPPERASARDLMAKLELLAPNRSNEVRQTGY